MAERSVQIINKNGLHARPAAEIVKIAAKFQSARVVIVHGASGQGKTTLAYRYLREYFPEKWRFQVKAVEGRQHALSLARALSGQAMGATDTRLRAAGRTPDGLRRSARARARVVASVPRQR